MHGEGTAGPKPAPKRPRRLLVGFRPEILLALCSVLIALLAGEVALRYLAPIPDPFARFKVEDRAAAYVPSAHEPNYRLTITPEPGLPGVTSASVFHTNNLGFRGGPLVQPKPADEFRVFLVGGSTMETMLLGGSEALDRVVQTRLQGWPGGSRNVKVYNTAKSGDKSYDHVALIVHRLLHLEPDLLVVMAGVNDLRAAMLGADYLLLSGSRAMKYTLPILLKFAATELQIPRRVYAALHRLTIDERERLEQITLVTDYAEKVRLRQGRPLSDRVPLTDVGPYRENLLTIEGAARAHGVALVWVTHPSTWNSVIDPRVAAWHWMTYLEGENYREDLLDQALTAYNDAVRRVAAEHSTPLVDLAADMPKSLEYFVDDVHFNARGAARAGGLLADVIRTAVTARK